MDYVSPSNKFDHEDWISKNVYGTRGLFSSDFRSESSFEKKTDNKKREKFEGTWNSFESIPIQKGSKKKEGDVPLFILNEERGKIFVGVEQWWNYFHYSITAIKQDYKKSQRIVYKVENVHLEKLPMTERLLKTMLFDMKCNEDFIEGFIANAPWMKYNSKAPLELDIHTVLTYIRNCTDTKIFIDERKKYPLNIALCNHNGLKYYFLYDEIEFLLQYYKWNEIFGLKWKNISSLVKMFGIDISILCFRKLIPFKSIYFTEEDGKGIATEKKISELSLEKVENYYKTLGIIIPIDLHLKLKIYKSAHGEFDSKDYYIELFSIKGSVSSLFKNNIKLFHDAMTWLCNKKIIVCIREGQDENETNRVYLYRNFKQEMCIAQVIRKLFEKDYSNRLCDGMEEEEEDLPIINKKHTIDEIKNKVGHLCSEQMNAFLYALYRPVCVWTGKAGSGKTTALKTLKEFYPEQTILVTAFQKRNINALSNIFPGRAYTTHKLILLHNSTCHKSPTRSKDYNGIGDNRTTCGWNFNNCIFEGIKVFVLEESSTEPTNLGSQIIASVYSCATNLEKMIFTGDYGQTLPIGGGNLIEDLISSFEKLDCFIEFFHNHRTGLGILSDNQEAIRERNCKGLKFDGKNAIFIPINNLGELHGTLIDALAKYKVPEYNSQIISRTNNVKDIANFAYQSHYLKREKREHEELMIKKNYGKRVPYVFYSGRKFTFKKNDYENDVSNNECLELKRIEDFQLIGTTEIVKTYTNTSQFPEQGFERRLVVRSIDDSRNTMERKIKLTNVLKSSMARFGACTILGAQGGQYEIVIFIIVDGVMYNTNRNIYTAFSRTICKMIVIGKMDLIEKSIITEEPIRKTGLSEKIYRLCKSFEDKLETFPDIGIDNKIKMEGNVLKGKRQQEKERLKQEKIYSDNAYRVMKMCKDMWILVFKFILETNVQKNLYDMKSICQVLRLGRVSREFYEISQSDNVWKVTRGYFEGFFQSIYNRNPDFIFQPLIINKEMKHFDFFVYNHRFFRKYTCSLCNCIYNEFSILKSFVESVEMSLNIEENQSAQYWIKCKNGSCRFTFKINYSKCKRDSNNFFIFQKKEDYFTLEIINAICIFDLEPLNVYKVT
jgi:hypothetical protein